MNLFEWTNLFIEIVSQNFTPYISGILNITPDHISRHKTFDNYYKIKLKITQFQRGNQYFLTFNELKNINTNAKKIIVNNNKKYKSNLIGEFNQKNIAFCEKICELLNVNNKEFKKYIKTFYPIKFRLEYMGKIKGVSYINDSKSTNPDSCIKALKSMKKPVVLLLGGSDKGNYFYDIFSLSKSIRLAIIYGQTANKLEQDAHFMGFYNIVKFENLCSALSHLKEYLKK